MKRRLTKLVVFLLLGAVVNVAVAWGGVLSLFPGNQIWSRWSDVWWDALPENEEIACLVWTKHRAGIYKFYVGSIRMTVPTGSPSHVETPPGWVLGIMDEHALDSRSSYKLIVDASGWPFLGLYSLADYDIFEVTRGWPLPGIHDRTTWTSDSFALPIHPIWPGFAINTLFYAAIVAVLWLLTLGPFAARRFIRRKRGHCIKCGYDLRGTEHEVCPECGAGCDGV